MLLKNLLAGISVAIGLVVLGIYMNLGLQSFSNKERVVTVKGLAEKEIKAVSARIEIDYSFSGDVAKEIISRIDNRTGDIEAYLKTGGYDHYTVSELSLTDRKTYYTETYRDGKTVRVKQDRYVARKSIALEISDVTKAAGIANAMNIDLISKDLTADLSTSYQFPELNAIKPELIAESTRNARIAGEQFAKDSQSRLGKIKTAAQGPISIAGNYEESAADSSSIPNEPYIEKARVVSTIVFFLED
ncbi:MAG: SIMPL domain-containing protein [Azonexus sp.]|jgi:hypothetical protein|nr:SIMPL domain-containing protein [Azonexus sp.]